MTKTLLQIHEENISYPHIRGTLFRNIGWDNGWDSYFGTFIAVSREKDIHGRYRESKSCVDAQKAIDTIAVFDGASKERWQEREKCLFYFRPILFPQKSFKTGDLVDVLEEIKESTNFDRVSEGMKAMIGQKGLEIKKGHEVKGNKLFIPHNFTYEVYTPNKNDFFYFPQHALAPHHPVKPKHTNDEIAEARKVLEDAGIIRDGKVIVQ